MAAEATVRFTWQTEGKLNTGTITATAGLGTDIDTAVNVIMAGLAAGGYAVTATPQVQETVTRDARTVQKVTPPADRPGAPSNTTEPARVPVTPRNTPDPVAKPAVQL